MKRFVFLLILAPIVGVLTRSAVAQDSPSTLYIPLIGLTSVPNPLALPTGPGKVRYDYAVKNFVTEVPLRDVQVVDDTCDPVSFIGGDDNHDDRLDYSETWRYECTTNVFETTYSTATATGTANLITAAHKAYATVVVGSDTSPPLVSIVNVTKVAYPLSLPAEGGDIVFTYRVNNPGVVPLSNVAVVDDKCLAMSSKLGDTNGNNFLDTNEVWVYTCSTHLTQTTTNTVTVTAFANGLEARSDAILTINVDIPTFPNTGTGDDIKMAVWGVLCILIMLLIVVYFFVKKTKRL